MEVTLHQADKHRWRLGLAALLVFLGGLKPEIDKLAYCLSPGGQALFESVVIYRFEQRARNRRDDTGIFSCFHAATIRMYAEYVNNDVDISVCR